jgi:hypothetical protein
LQVCCVFECGGRARGRGGGRTAAAHRRGGAEGCGGRFYKGKRCSCWCGGCVGLCPRHRPSHHHAATQRRERERETERLHQNLVQKRLWRP